MSSMDWHSLVSTEERLANILRIAELAHAVPFQEVLNRAKQVEEGVFQTTTSREFYIASMDQLVNYMKKTIEDKTKQHLEQLAEKGNKELLSGQINNDSLTKISKTGHDQLTKKQLELKNLWERRIEEIMEQTRRQQAFQSQRLQLLLQNLQLQQLLKQQKTRQTQPTNLIPFLQQPALLPQPVSVVLQTTLSTTQQQPINHLFQQPTTILLHQQQTIPQFCQQPQTYPFQHQQMTFQQSFPLAQPFTLQPLMTQQPLTAQTSTSKSEQSHSSLPQDITYFLVKDANVHKEDFKEALKLPINEQKRHPPPGAPVIPVHALKVEGTTDTSSQVQPNHQFK